MKFVFSCEALEITARQEINASVLVISNQKESSNEKGILTSKSSTANQTQWPIFNLQLHADEKTKKYNNVNRSISNPGAVFISPGSQSFTMFIMCIKSYSVVLWRISKAVKINQMNFLSLHRTGKKCLYARARWEWAHLHIQKEGWFCGLPTFL